MNIRTFNDSDTDQVEELWKLVFPEGSPHNAPRKVIQDKMQIQPELFFVAVVEGNIAGTIYAGYDGHRGWLYGVAVGPEYRRRGIGARLVSHALAALRKVGCPKVNLQIRAGNAQVAAFYNSMGFHVEERISMGLLLS